MTDISSRCSVLVPSCDAYSDLWTPFFTLFWRHWQDCPFAVNLGSNQKVFGDPRVNVIHSGQGRNWTNRVREHIESLQTPFVLLTLEDFFLRRPVDTGRVLFCLEALDRLGGHMLRLVARPGPNIRLAGVRVFGAVECGTPYRVSTQTAIWRTETLLALLKADESIWEFEIQGNARSNRYSEGFFAVWKDIMTYDHHVVEKGKWFRNEARRFERASIGCDFSARATMTRADMIRWRLSKTRSLLLDLLPWRQRLKLVRFVRSLNPMSATGWRGIR